MRCSGRQRAIRCGRPTPLHVPRHVGLALLASLRLLEHLGQEPRQVEEVTRLLFVLPEAPEPQIRRRIRR